ncbi:MAG: WbqC family protein, partial [Paludibacter sp.]|nr:WbqC family protein [Paludibacter sp.]
PAYYQIFTEKFGFIPNLSIIDLLFNMGNEAEKYLKEINIS